MFYLSFHFIWLLKEPGVIYASFTRNTPFRVEALKSGVTRLPTIAFLQVAHLSVYPFLEATCIQCLAVVGGTGLGPGVLIWENLSIISAPKLSVELSESLKWVWKWTRSSLQVTFSKKENIGFWIILFSDTSSCHMPIFLYYAQKVKF